MCGRFAQISRGKKMVQGVPVKAMPEDIVPNFNVTPGARAHVILKRRAEISLDKIEWGFRLKDRKTGSEAKRVINARSETILKKPLFVNSFRQRRCLVPVDGFYEWQGPSSCRKPFFIRFKTRETFALAGFWREGERDTQELSHREFCIMTTTPNDLLKSIHDRMPVIIPWGLSESWLDDGPLSAKFLEKIFHPMSAEKMEAYHVSRYVNSPANNSLECIKKEATT